MITPIRALVLAILISVFAFSVPAFSYAATPSLTITRGDSEINNARLIVLDESSDTTDVAVLSFRMKATGDQDIDIDSIPVTFLISTGKRLSSLVSEARLLADGDEVASVAVSGKAKQIVFNDVDFTIDSNETVEFEVLVDFKEAASLADGTMLAARFGEAETDSKNFQAEDEEGNAVTDPGVVGSVEGGPHTLSLGGAILNFVDESVVVSEDGMQGTYKITFDLTAIERDIYLPNTASDTGVVGARFAITGSDFAGTKTAFVSGEKSPTPGYYLIDEGEDGRFTLIVTLAPKKTGFYGIELKEVYVRSPITGPYQSVVPNGKDYKTPMVSLGGSESPPLGVYKFYIDGKLISTSLEPRRELSLQLCKLQIELNKKKDPTKSVRCTWNDELLAEYVPPKVTTGTYIGYLNGKQFIRTENITEADALANCKQNHKNNPSSSVRCTWNGKEIYNAAPIAKAPDCSLSISPNRVMLGQKFTASWSSVHATSATLSHGGGSVPVNGSKTMGIGAEGDYLVTLTVKGAGGTDTCTATVAVTPLEGASVKFNQNTLKSTSETPRIGGSAVNLTSLYIGGTLTTNPSVTFTSAVAKVKDGKWAVTLPKLQNGVYKIGAVGPGYVTVGEAELTVNAPTSTATTTSAVIRGSMFSDLIAGVGMVLAEIPREFLAIFTRG